MMISIAVVTSVFIPSQKWQIWLYRRWAAMVLGIAGARVSVVGADRVDATRNYIIASNHLSLMDTPVVLRRLPVDFKFLAKQELLKIPFLGWYLKRAGHLTVSRGSIRSSLESMNECARLVRERRLSVLIFPEGTRGLGPLQSFKEGAAYLAIQSGVPLLPVAIWGTQNVLSAKTSHFRSAPVELRLGAPIEVDGLTLRDRALLTRRLEQEVRLLLGQDEPPPA